MLTVEPPAHAITNYRTLHMASGSKVAETKCDWCGLPYETADVIPLRNLEGHHLENLMFHHECWGHATRELRARLEVARQMGKLPKEMP